MAPKPPKVPVNAILALFKDLEIEIVESGKIPKREPLILYNTKTLNTRVENVPKEKQDPIKQFKHDAWIKQLNNGIMGGLVGIGILGTTSNIIKSLQTASVNPDGASSLAHTWLGLSEKDREESLFKTLQDLQDITGKLEDMLEKKSGDDKPPPKATPKVKNDGDDGSKDVGEGGANESKEDVSNDKKANKDGGDGGDEGDVNLFDIFSNWW